MAVKEYVEIFNALLTPLIAILTAYIAWQQYQVNHSSLRSQLYERRLVVFRAFMSYLVDISREGRTTAQRAAQFYSEVIEAEFLFRGNITKKAEELYLQGIELAHVHEQLYPADKSPGLPVGDERSKVSRQQTALLKWFGEQTKVVKELFKREMRIK